METSPTEKRPTISPLSKLIRKQRVVKYHSAKSQPEAESVVGYVPPGISKSEFLDCHSTFLNLDNDDDGEETAAEVSSMGCPPVSSMGCPPSPNKPFATPTPVPKDRNHSETSLDHFPNPKACSPTWELDSTPSRSSSYHHQLREKLSMNELVKSLPAPDPGVARHCPASIVNYHRTYTNQIDTMTPVVVVPESASTDDLGMASRQQGERPGEVLIFESCARSAPSLEEPFSLSFVKVYRNTLSDDLRLVTTTADDAAKVTSTHNVRNNQVKLVPMYAYDSRRKNQVYLQEIDKRNYPAGATKATPVLSSPLYEFNSFQDALEFQGKILEEDVLLDISSIRFLKCALDGFHVRQIDAPRVQLWHQRRSISQSSREAGSFSSSGTTLSAACPDRTTLLCARLVMFLGRAQEYLTIFVTDDVSIKDKDPATLTFVPTKYAGIDRLKSRRGIKCLQVSEMDSTAGIRLDKKGLRMEDEDSFTMYKTFELSFENEQGRDSFRQTWSQVLEARRVERLRLKKIRLEMAQNIYSGPFPTKILM